MSEVKVYKARWIPYEGYHFECLDVRENVYGGEFDCKDLILRSDYDLLAAKLVEANEKLRYSEDDRLSMHLSLERLSEQDRNIGQSIESIKRILHNAEYSRSKAHTERDREVFEIIYNDAINAKNALNGVKIRETGERT